MLAGSGTCGRRRRLTELLVAEDALPHWGGTVSHHQAYKLPEGATEADKHIRCCRRHSGACLLPCHGNALECCTSRAPKLIALARRATAKHGYLNNHQ